MEYRDKATRIDILLEEADEIEQTARSIQAQRPSPLSDAELRKFRNRYQQWYASALLVLPDDVRPQFIKEFEGGRWSAGIQNFISDPARPNIIFAQASQENPESLSVLFWQHPFDSTFGQRFIKQQALLRQARERYGLLSTIPEEPIFGLKDGTYPYKQRAPVDTDADEEGAERLNKKGVVFVAHGRSPLYIQVYHYLKDELDLEPIAFETEDHTSEQISEVLNQYLDCATAAVIVMTGEEKTLDNRTLARQNVIHEAGLFQAKLGFDRVVLLKEEGVENFSNTQGIVYIPFNPLDVSGCFYRLRRFLARHHLVAK